MTDYGRSFSCVTDLDPTFAVVTGRRLLAEAIVRRITTPRGALIDDPSYGIDIRDWLNDHTTARDLARRISAIDAEIVRDERIVASRTTFTFVDNVLVLTISLTDADGPFSLVMQVKDLTVSILKVTG